MKKIETKEEFINCIEPHLQAFSFIEDIEANEGNINFDKLYNEFRQWIAAKPCFKSKGKITVDLNIQMNIHQKINVKSFVTKKPGGNRIVQSGYYKEILCTMDIDQPFFNEHFYHNNGTESCKRRIFINKF